MIEAIFIVGLSLLVLMGLTWVLSLRLHNAGIVDIVWAGSFALVALFGAAYFPGIHWRQGLFVVMVVCWSLRLAWHLLVRVKGHHPIEDGRYAAMRVRWGSQANWNMFIFFQFQGLLILILSFPFLLVIQDQGVGVSWTQWVGVGLWLLALVGESTADQQLKSFKADPGNKGRVCQIGLWRYSRHPNYFFEWLIWVAFAVFALGTPWGWVGWYAPALMLYFLLRVTGIPMTEQQTLQTKGEAYRAYQRSTPSAFVPWFPQSQ